MIIPEQDTPKSNITLGNLYDMNKDLVKKHEQTISLNDFKEKYSIFNEYLTNNNATYYMLLCNEERDYTLFNFIHEWTDDIKYFAFNELTECIFNRGQVYGFDITQDNGAIEIWIEKDNGMHCYYFFKYDVGVIEC